MGISIKDYNYQNILFVHNFVFIYLIFVFCLVFAFFAFILIEYNYNRNIYFYKLLYYLRRNKYRPNSFKHVRAYSKEYMQYLNISLNKNHNLYLEVVWTIFPILIILELIFPTLSLVADDEIDNESSLQTVNVIGNQWYWNYELNLESYTKFYNSNLIRLEEGNPEHFNLTRLLATTETLMIPVGIKTSFYITSNDVIHSYAIPGLGVKVDAIPGRLNLKNIMTTRLGLYSGMCSELCGIDHGFMPISLKSLSYSNFIYILSTDKRIINLIDQWFVDKKI